MKLPRHIRGIGWDGKKEKPREKSPYWDGRWALSHPNGYYPDERSVEMLRLLLQRADNALISILARTTTRLDGVTPVVGEAEADLINTAYQALDEIDKHFPLVECWVIYNTYEWAHGGESPVQPFFGFFDLDTALTVAQMWQEYKDKWPGTQYYVQHAGAEMHMVIDPKIKDLERLRPNR